MPEGAMLECSFGGYRPYTSDSWTDARGTHKVYKGMSEVRRVYVSAGRVIGWDD